MEVNSKASVRRWADLATEWTLRQCSLIPKQCSVGSWLSLAAAATAGCHTDECWNRPAPVWEAGALIDPWWSRSSAVSGSEPSSRAAAWLMNVDVTGHAAATCHESRDPSSCHQLYLVALCSNIFYVTFCIKSALWWIMRKKNLRVSLRIDSRALSRTHTQC